MLFLTSLDPTISYKLREKVQFTCSCGNVHVTTWKSYSTGSVKSCGKCAIFSWVASGRIEFSNLTLVSDISKINRLSDRAEWMCKCGNTKSIVVKSVLRGLTKSCGQCVKNIQTQNLTGYKDKKNFDEWKLLNPFLISSLKQEWSAGSAVICTFQCTCGKTYERKFFKYKEGVSTCGKCHVIDVKRGDIAGFMKYDGTGTKIKINSYSKDWFLCVCGKRSRIIIQHVYIRNQKTCGKCHAKHSEWWSKAKFGRLSVKNSEAMDGVFVGSEEITEFMCDCGLEVSARVDQVTSGMISSCGNCRRKILQWFEHNEQALLDLVAPVSQIDFPKGGPRLVNTVKKLADKASFSCWLCGRHYLTRMCDVISGKSLSCGCVSGKVSKQNWEVHKFLQSNGIESELEFDLNGMRYDIAIPTKRVVIELHGLRWHSKEFSKKRDFKKAVNAWESKWKLLVIFEDEWRFKKQIFKSMILSAVNMSKTISVRSSKYKVSIVDSKTANLFYESYHYIGKCTSPVHLGVFFDSNLLACMSFGKPTRQSKYQWEITRMCSVPNVRIHGIWSKILKEFISKHDPTSIVSFSDNRLFSGRTYGKIGFRLDGNVRQDYYWAKSCKRHHKSSMRKHGEKSTESEIRGSQGFKKIWDLGKKRWVMVVR